MRADAARQATLCMDVSGQLGRGFALCPSQENGRGGLNPVFWVGKTEFTVR